MPPRSPATGRPRSGALGVLVATLTARLLDCDAPSVSSGLYGFNGILVGAALPTFIASSPQLWAAIVIGAAASTVVTAAFSATLTDKWGIPGSTGPFVLTGWLMVAAAYSFGRLQVTGDAPRLAADLVRGAPAFRGRRISSRSSFATSRKSICSAAR
ncbi:hypothetical protein GCM10025880_41510 [Methylorubrum aminovorans]|nr:urea transporter [Methylorubrum aminovorans]GMA77734.1 hypothetical protein GCM10025880_41510 [Methylorubrum aminovorans]